VIVRDESPDAPCFRCRDAASAARYWAWANSLTDEQRAQLKALAERVRRDREAAAEARRDR
jgi:hypothetical protein